MKRKVAKKVQDTYCATTKTKFGAHMFSMKAAD